MNMRPLLIAATFALATPLPAQTATAAEHIVIGDRAHDAMNADAALTHYQAAIQADPKGRGQPGPGVEALGNVRAPSDQLARYVRA